MQKNAGHLFPAFVPEYGGYETEALGRLGITFPALLKIASEVTETDLECFDIHTNSFIDDELKSQYITYIMACAVSDYLHRADAIPAITAGYSMGLYAALYHARSISFADGLRIIRTAYRCIDEVTRGKTFSMAVIGGLSEQDVLKIINCHAQGCQLTNINSSVSFVISGDKKDVETAVTLAREEGAMQTRIMNVAHPYHSTQLQAASKKLHHELQPITFSQTIVPLVSVIDQQLIHTPEHIKNEVTRNISHHINWHKTFLFMLEKGITEFIECGGGESLQKIGKFIEGDFRITGLKKL